MPLVSSARSLWRLTRFVTGHPLTRDRRVRALARLLRWQIGSRLLPMPVSMPWTNSTFLEVCRGQTGSTGNYYVGLAEFEDMAFVLHALRTGDTFVDVGANIGAYSVLASSVGAAVLAVEPVPDTFHALQRNVALNTHCPGRIDARAIGLGRENGELRFTTGLDTVNHVVADDAAETGSAATAVLPVRRLDDVMADAGLAPPTVLKIDAEGYEIEILRGASDTIAHDALLAVIVELNGAAARYGGRDSDVDEYLRSNGFVPAGYRPFERSVVLLDAPNSRDNTIYVRDLDEVRRRVSGAPPFDVDGRSV